METKSVTVLLRDWSNGDQGAFEQLVPLVYQELRRIAALHLRGERPGHTLQPTDLVSEAFLRLCGSAAPQVTDRLHFFAVAARNMRQVLVDHARKRGASKRGDGVKPVTLDEGIAVFNERPYDLVDLDRALDELAKMDDRKARAVELHYFAGLSQAEVASVLDVHVNTVARDLRLAEAWLLKHLRRRE